MGRTYIGSLLAAFCFLLTDAFPQKIAALPATSVPSCGPLVQQVLSCPALGFTYNVPFGWVDRTDDFEQTIESDPARKAASVKPESTRSRAQTTSKTLLAAFERPPGTGGDTINPSVIIAVEDRSLYAGINTAEDYFGPLSEVAEHRGLSMDGDPYLFAVGSKRVARADFRARGQKSSAQQTSLVVLGKSYILSFTFLAGSSDEINNLAANLTFTAGVRKPASK